MAARRLRRRSRSKYAFALYEVLIGVAIFAVGVIALGRAVEQLLYLEEAFESSDEEDLLGNLELSITFSVHNRC